MRHATLAILLLATAGVVPAVGGQGARTNLAGSSPQALATTFLHTLSLAASARDDLLGFKATGNPIVDSMNGIVTDRTAANRLGEAALLVEPFLRSDDESVRVAAESVARFYKRLGDKLLEGVTYWEKFARTRTADDIASLVPESANHAADIQQVWRLLPLIVANVTDALIDMNRLTDGKLAHLRLTRAERTKLITDIGRMFPNVRPDQKSGQIVDVSVNLFREWLQGSWKSSDER